MPFHLAVVCIIDNCLCKYLGQYQFSFTALCCLDSKCKASIIAHGLQVIRHALFRDVRSRHVNGFTLSPSDRITLTPFVSASRRLLVKILDNYNRSNDVIRILRATLISRAHALVRIRRILSLRPCFRAWKTLMRTAVRQRRVSQCISSWGNVVI